MHRHGCRVRRPGAEDAAVGSGVETLSSDFQLKPLLSIMLKFPSNSNQYLANESPIWYPLLQLCLQGKEWRELKVKVSKGESTVVRSLGCLVRGRVGC